METKARLVARAVRFGVFRHARPWTAGGITVGYRRSRGDGGRDHDGVELAFPWIIRRARALCGEKTPGRPHLLVELFCPSA